MCQLFLTGLREASGSVPRQRHNRTWCSVRGSSAAAGQTHIQPQRRTLVPVYLNAAWRHLNFWPRWWHHRLSSWMFAGSAPELKGTKTWAEGNEHLSVETWVPHGAVRGPFRDCGRRAVVCICTEASELPDPLTEEGKFLLLLTVQPCSSQPVLSGLDLKT